MLMRSGISTITFTIILWLTDNLLYAAMTLTLTSLVIMLFYDLHMKKYFEPTPVHLEWRGILGIYNACWPLFVSSFIMNYLNNAPKYAINTYYDETVQNSYNILFMPAFTVVSCKEKPFLDLYNRTFEKHGVKMKSYVAVQKKILVIIYFLWKNNQEYNPEIYNIQEKEQELSSLLAFEKGIKNSPKRVEAIQGKHPVKDHSVLPLC